jgi:hypothetical protein
MNLFKVLALRAKSVIFHIGEAWKAEFSPATSGLNIFTTKYMGKKTILNYLEKP